MSQVEPRTRRPKRRILNQPLRRSQPNEPPAVPAGESGRKLKILFAIAEAYPFAKVGGLGDVGGALPKALADRGHDVRLMLPGYEWMDKGKAMLTARLPIGSSWEEIRCSSLGVDRGVEVLAIRNGQLFARDQVYGYADDDKRFILFSKAVGTIAAIEDWTPDVVHVHDWHLGLVPQYMRESEFRQILDSVATVFTIHNLGYQGPFGAQTVDYVGINGQFDGNLMARGIAFADAVSTVSEKYRDEIVSSRNSDTVHRLLKRRSKSVRGILNGVDYDEFDPRIDSHIPARFSSDRLAGKDRNKHLLRERSGLTNGNRRPVVGMVARLVEQKGLQLVCESLDAIAQLGAQVVVAGQGEESYSRVLSDAADRHAGKIAFHQNGEESIARLVYAGSDFFLAPSSYEPCGLGPLIALRYGSIPIVRKTGGMAQTISDYREDPHTGLGFTFERFHSRQLVETVQAAVDVYHQDGSIEQLQQRAMAADFSWGQSAEKYEQLYLEAFSRRPASPSRQVKTMSGGDR